MKQDGGVVEPRRRGNTYRCLGIDIYLEKMAKGTQQDTRLLNSLPFQSLEGFADGAR